MGSLKEVEISDVPTIPEYFRGKTIFITGGSGFMGQALIEKLLYSCPELDSIYLLMRQKRGVPASDRLEKLYLSDCFDRLRREKPTIFREKVHIVAGDVTELGLGLSENDRKLLINKVNVVFHAAASVRFNDHLEYAAKMNIRGTRELIELAKEMKCLSSFVHVSTTYCNTNHDVIDEVLYPPLADWRELLEICEKVDDVLTLQALTPKYMNGMPNTYVFTKHLAEHLVSEQRGKLPIAIIRPSIVISGLEEPAPGWINNFNGPVGLTIACGVGLQRAIYGKPDAKYNYIPVDVCIRNFIVVAWTRGIVKLEDNDNVKIYNCCVSKEDQIMLKDYIDICINLTKKKYPFQLILWNPTKPIAVENFLAFYIITLFCSVLPAIFVDLVLLLLGKKPKLLEIQRKIYGASLVLFYYTSRQWTIKNENFLKVRESIRKEDRKAFYYSTENLFHTSDYLDICAKGAKKYLLREDVDDMSRARAHADRMTLLDRFVRIVFCACVLWWITSARFIRNMFENEIGFTT